MSKHKIQKILVANRGEITIRVMKTCKEMGIKTVAVYSEIDQDALHVRMADEAYLLGPAPARESYLHQEKIVDIAKKTQSDAIHPGYGFLSENPIFVDLLEKNQIIFIGPNSKAIRMLGDKTAARTLAKSINVPIVPGTTQPIKSLDEAIETARKVSYPILLKAAGGGGGKGMRIVRTESELASSLRGSQSEALSAFGDDRIYIEKYIETPRHIEVQVLADHHGNIIHLGERECSVQRRHQKIIEESPSTIVTQEIRDRLTKAATSLIKASGYTNAGTVEFIFDKDRNFYFLEVNTRLQVEHPVTEMRVGIDIVREQIGIAEGNPLSFNQEEIVFNGHSIECRVYAEDPTNNFYPSIGKIVSLKSPIGFGIREDRGIEEGNEISSYYDPLISKLVVWARTRNEALERMRAALTSYEIFGVRNNLSLCHWIMNHPKFVDGDFDTNFLSNYFKPEVLAKIPLLILKVGTIASILNNQILPTSPTTSKDGEIKSKWRTKLIEHMR
ncbi:MAG: acetyl-CoA carboxylase biotin carboxylase subunit [Bacteroidota bacterium]|nr:acetyl-CoA carboxylase biotin carboxylase subunit [Bacteroidota bacterium]